ncbi:tetrahydromethanopterin S-methyltransferase subunit A [Microbacterium foliorum]|uniref:Tetrahydromethanopterin S-methyltransferase subunit A n=1 Tax=Microbacterium foliorum TaxID=104336 RepID=A0ABU1HPQ7_9MICO|nr:hypothetical protein [Microbacterium foliorum]MDR6142030.1 tetrahydromethanopterin S-methyltransferase subunit A [Microbacterium foliorum]
MSTDQPVESSTIAANAVTVEKILAGEFKAENLPVLAITADKIPAGEIRVELLVAGAPTPVTLSRAAIEPANVPGHDEIRRILQSEGAPPHMTLDIGGSEDVDGDGLVTVSLGEDGHELVFKDA